METLGLIAGNRRLPFLWVAEARRAGFKVAAIGFNEETDQRLGKEVEAFEMISLGQLGRMIKFFKAHGVKRAVMQGQIQHKQIYAKLKADWRARWLLAKQALFVRDFRTEAILGSIAGELGSHGIHLESATWMMEPYLAKKGKILGSTSIQMRRDIAFGVKLARGLNSFDVGQTVVVKRQSCVAVESIEGTDACIERAAKLAGPGCVVIKLARPKQDLRFDIPVVGLRTFQVLTKAKAAALVVEAGKTLFLDRESCLGLAKKAGLAVLSAEAAR
jgi:DUF1009 family protein